MTITKRLGFSGLDFSEAKMLNRGKIWTPLQDLIYAEYRLLIEVHVLQSHIEFLRLRSDLDVQLPV